MINNELKLDHINLFKYRILEENNNNDINFNIKNIFSTDLFEISKSLEFFTKNSYLFPINIFYKLYEIGNFEDIEMDFLVFKLIKIFLIETKYTFDIISQLNILPYFLNSFEIINDPIYFKKIFKIILIYYKKFPKSISNNILEEIINFSIESLKIKILNLKNLNKIEENEFYISSFLSFLIQFLPYKSE